MKIKWPFVRRSTYDKVCFSLYELDKSYHKALVDKITLKLKIKSIGVTRDPKTGRFVSNEQ